MSGEEGDQIDWIGIDWGTTYLRAWALSNNGEVLAHLSSSDGMANLAKSEFEPALLSLIGNWLHPGRTMPVFACGMVGARQGWIEAPYQTAPCKPLSTKRLVKANSVSPQIDVHIVPGIMQIDPADVMRGEETQIAGFLSLEPNYDGVICLPGTHSKWVRVKKRKIVGFSTFLTGELFELLSTKSVLRHSVANEGWDQSAFLAGVQTAFLRPELFAAALFSIRAQTLIANAGPDVARAKLSGYLVGLELCGAQDYWLGQKIAIIGTPALAIHYQDALGKRGISSSIFEAQKMTLAGLSAAREKTRECEPSL